MREDYQNCAAQRHTQSHVQFLLVKFVVCFLFELQRCSWLFVSVCTRPIWHKVGKKRNMYETLSYECMKIVNSINKQKCDMRQDSVIH